MEREGSLPRVNEFATNMLPRLLDERQTARIMAVSVAALRRWRHEGRGPQFVRLGRCVRYDLRTIEHFLLENSSPIKEAADCESAAKRQVRNARATTRCM
jgi:predicted DNA-binding transcriptional regulator AlpA